MTRDDQAEIPLRRLLLDITDRSNPGRAWLGSTRPASGALSAYVPAGPGTDRIVAGLTKGVRDAWSQSRGWSSPSPGIERRLNSLRHRAFLDADRFEALLRGEVSAKLAGLRRGRLRYYVVLDLRFSYLLNQLRCLVSMSIWSEVPRHAEHRPAELANRAAKPLAAGVDTYRELFEGVAYAADELLHDHGFVRADGTVGDGAHGLPVFWVVRPTSPRVDPMDYLRDGTQRCQMTNHLARTFLKVGDVRDCVVSHSVLNGHLLTMRRPEEGPDGLTLPRYLMIPGGLDLTREESLDRLELDIAAVITRLTDLEAEGASRLLAAKADLEIWRNHLRVYNAVVERGVFLWDALSTHLPIRRWFKLGRAHRAVELLHQILLQAVGDLGHISALIRQAAADIAEASDDVWDKYNANITERHSTRETGLRAALTETGLFAHVKREAVEIATEAQRVKGAYDDLLDVITHAFDERRVREFDALQKFNVLLAVAVGLVTFVTVLDATVEMKAMDAADATMLGGDRRVSVWSVALSWLVGGGLVVVGGIGVLLFRRLGRLGSKPFRKRYDGRRLRRYLGRAWWPNKNGPPQRGFWRWARPACGVWQVLKDISTDRLERKAADDTTDWAALDQRLAAEFAAMWDEVTDMPVFTRANAAKRDIRALSRQIEQWGMHSLLLTERARRMYRYQLPVLTCLFRCCDRIEGSFLKIEYLSRTNMMAAEDFDRSLTRLGFSGGEIRRIDDWLTGPSYESAAEALQRIRRLGLRDSMSRDERAAALALITRTLRT